MIRKNTLASGKLLLASFVATGLAAAPVTLSLQLNTASAQTGSSQDTGAQDTGAQDTGAQDTGRSAGDEGVAEERIESQLDGSTTNAEDSVYEILGTTREEAEAADTHTSATAQYGPLKAYQAEVERGNLDAAAENLAAVAKQPITEEMVTQVNTELGVETRLTARQLAEAAATKQESSDN